jgi:hypothetical protein
MKDMCGTLEHVGPTILVGPYGYTPDTKNRTDVDDMKILDISFSSLVESLPAGKRCVQTFSRGISDNMFE